jgi:MoaA/NifB/PqqE/SkfB family radical SAM enzyme
MTEYLFREKRKTIFAESSGSCNLQCSYCITNRPRIDSSLDKDDFSFLFNSLGENIYFIFSGLGDFFCGYSSKDQLLRFLLRHDVIIYLDINGVEIRELNDPDLEGKEKIGEINVSYHFSAMKEKKVINRWVDSIKKLQENKFNYNIKMILSPHQRGIWEDGILFYAKEVQPISGQKMVLVPDGLVDLTIQFDDLTKVADTYKDVVVFLGRGSMFNRKPMPPNIAQPCPAGSRYFRILNSGDIMPCEYFGNELNIRLGNTKRKELTTFKCDVNCSYAGFCDCTWATRNLTGLLNEKNEQYRHTL